MEFNVVVRALVDVLVWGLNNSGTIFNFEEMEVDELARTTDLKSREKVTKSKRSHGSEVFFTV